MRTIRFGIIGLGLMGREFASAVARWCHLTRMEARPEIVAICNRTLSGPKVDWFQSHFPSIQQVTADYRALLANPEVEAVYVAVPHHLHEEIYCAVIRAGKHLLGEKPFGVDLRACRAILACLKEHPQVQARCASQYLFWPGAQRLLRLIREGALGRVIEVDSGFLHSSDLDPRKPINWKRMVEFNGEYGSLGDLGFHVAVVTARAGWRALNTRAVLSNIVPERPDATGRLVPCETWDNATLLTELEDAERGACFPWTLKVHRIMPGERNTWYLAVYGTGGCARFSLNNPRRFEFLRYEGREQAWQREDLGFEAAYETITGPIFEFGATDAFQQLVAAFVYELTHPRPLRWEAACPTPEEMVWGHRLFTAALRSQAERAVVEI